MLLHDVIMTSYCCQRYAECLATTVFQQDSARTGTPRRARATVELLRQERPNFLTSNLWPPNSPDLNSVDYEIWAVMQHRVYHRQTYSVDELKRRLIDIWCGLKQSILTRLLTSNEEDIRVSMLNEDTSSTDCELTMFILSISVALNVTCLSVTSLITKSCQQRWPIHSCSFYKGSTLADLSCRVNSRDTMHKRDLCRRAVSVCP